MAGGKAKRRGKPMAKRPGRKPSPRALGNDPFQRGAAVRVVAATAHHHGGKATLEIRDPDQR